VADHSDSLSAHLVAHIGENVFIRFGKKIGAIRSDSLGCV
jgi:hypothetical protein